MNGVEGAKDLVRLFNNEQPEKGRPKEILGVVTKQ